PREAGPGAEARAPPAASEAAALARAKAWADEDPRDTDGDAIPDRLDNCPRERGPASNHGCPKAQKQIVVLREDRIDILQRVYFSTGRARIEKRSDRLLDQVARVIREHPRMSIEVRRQRDAQGSRVASTAVSPARAEAVVGALIRRGVAGGRLEARGYGPSQPVAPNTTRAGRERNRRVEFRIR